MSLDGLISGRRGGLFFFVKGQAGRERENDDKKER